MLWHKKRVSLPPSIPIKNCIWYNAIQSSQVCVSVQWLSNLCSYSENWPQKIGCFLWEERRLPSTNPLWNSSPRSSLPVPGIESLRTDGQGWVQVRPSSLKLPQGFIARKQICESRRGQTCGRERALRPKDTRSRRRFPVWTSAVPKWSSLGLVPGQKNTTPWPQTIPES